MHNLLGENATTSIPSMIYVWYSDGIVTPQFRCARCLPVIRRRCHVIFLRVAFYHVIMCIALHTCSSHESEPFPRCPFCNLALLCSPAFPFCLLLLAGVKRSRNGPRLVKWPWYSTGRPPVKFRAIWTSFDTPRLTGGPERPRVCCSPTPLQFGPKPPKSYPLSRAFDHDRVAENRTSFGLT